MLRSLVGSEMCIRDSSRSTWTSLGWLDESCNPEAFNPNLLPLHQFPLKPKLFFHVIHNLLWQVLFDPYQIEPSPRREQFTNTGQQLVHHLDALVSPCPRDGDSESFHLVWWSHHVRRIAHKHIHPPTHPHTRCKICSDDTPVPKLHTAGQTAGISTAHPIRAHGSFRELSSIWVLVRGDQHGSWPSQFAQCTDDSSTSCPNLHTQPCSMDLTPVSYTHLTLPTKRIV
eukprot:TRINITY_DN20547_c0_g1_i3.p1 TRINITY_DN20547_c0_g1~~TRINITY_DN20547_c0_g1_i3.p1  ORF type:complete len:243 (+),score=46.69 TRINITY_DN20547_c0_g1_i3:46-729(+)